MSVVDETLVRPLLDRVKGKPSPNRVASVPERMAGAFRTLYEHQVTDLNAQLAVLGGSDPSLTATINARIMLLEGSIEELGNYIGTFPP